MMYEFLHFLLLLGCVFLGLLPWILLCRHMTGFKFHPHPPKAKSRNVQIRGQVWVFRDDRNKKIRKVVEQPDGSWMVLTEKTNAKEQS